MSKIWNKMDGLRCPSGSGSYGEHKPLAVGVTAMESVLEPRTKLPCSGPVKLHSTSLVSYWSKGIWNSSIRFTDHFTGTDTANICPYLLRWFW